jgi:hypothetical protein
MNWMPDLRFYLTLIQIGAFLLLLSKLFRTGLWRKYRCFTWYIFFECVRLPLMASLNIRTNVYAHVYFATQPILWLSLVLVVFEVFQLVLSDHAGIATLGRKALTWALGASAIVSGATLLLESQQQSESALLFNFMLVERLVMTSLLVLLLCLTVFWAYFPIPLSGNIRAHASIFAFYFSVRTSLLWVRTFFGLDYVVTLNLVGQVLAVSCLLAWTIMLRKTGEVTPDRRPPDSDSEGRLLSKLESLNETLMGSTRK